MKKQFLLGQAALFLGVRPYQIVYLLTTAQVPQPDRIGGRRMFDELDLQRLAKALRIPFPIRPKKSKEPDET